ncbi:MAG: 30S ribosomal protein S1 [Flavobacteriaceae bacterium]|nr:30S ribosomal protein S1 [Flavobacteriaceae bacterium]MCY4266992.1 30S ribosomal protein S1 [Flavobacteriaceae bacterium]MCY4298779.1 30S ribosomal protein S1 [Flavobacteriaceae bacterium]
MSETKVTQELDAIEDKSLLENPTSDITQQSEKSANTNTEKVLSDESNQTSEASKEQVIKEAAQEEEATKEKNQNTFEVVEKESKTEKTPSEHFLENFDWEKHQGTVESIGDEKMKSFEAQVDNNFSGTVGHSIIKGKVVRIADREALLDINSKSEGVISLNEFRYNPHLAEGDLVDVIVDKPEDNTGQLVLSHRKARTIIAWKKVNEAFKNEEILSGMVKCRTKGGMIVDIQGIEAFLPGSQIDIKQIKDYDQYINKVMDFKIVKINQEFKNIVVSHKVLIEADMEEMKQEIISKLKKGNVLKGTVKSIMSYGVFIDLGAIDGLIHIGDLAWKRINHPSEIVEVDQTLDVVVLDFDKDDLKIQLGLKQLEDHPWEKLSPDIKEGSELEGKVVMIYDYGVFVEVENGVEGFMKVVDMSWSTYLRSAGEFVKEGDLVNVKVLSIDTEARKLSLGMKQLTKDPWTDITEKYQIKTKHIGTVRNLKEFGVFVELEPGIEGLVYLSDLSWTKRIKHPSDLFKLKDEIEVLVMEIDTKDRRLRLGHKQTKVNPWDKYEKQYAVGTVHKFKIDKVINGDGIIHFQENLVIYVKRNGMRTIEGKPLKKGQEAEFKIIEFNKDSSSVIASHSALLDDQEKENVSKRDEALSKKKIKKATLGELEGSVLSQLKDKMEDKVEQTSKTLKRKKREQDDKPFVIDTEENE